MPAERPSVSVIVPFLGSTEEAERTLEALARLQLGSTDEILIADNTTDGTFELASGPNPASLAVIHATAERSSYHARNTAAESASGEWLLFLDADCRPAPSLLEDYFAAPVDEDVGILAGGIEPAAQQSSSAARWAASREVLSAQRSMSLPGGPAGATANLLVRRRTWAELGGFHEGAPSGGDHEFCWRAQDAGWKLEHRPGAAVEHLHRERLGAVLRQFARYAAGNAWLNRRRPGAVPRPRLLEPLARAAAGVPWFVLSGRPDRARMKAIDALVAVAQSWGYLRANAVVRTPAAGGAAPGVLIVTDYFPVLTEQFVTREIAAITRAGRAVRVEAVARPARPLEGGARGLAVNWLEDEGPLNRLVAFARLTGRHPLRCAADLRLRQRFDPRERLPLRALAPMAVRLWLNGEGHLHVHFAALAAANALRIGEILSLPVSIAPHAHEVYRQPRSMAAKLERAAFVSTECAYNVERLRAMAPPQARWRIHSLPFGIDPGQIRRSSPAPAGRRVVAVGRLVAQKGFRHLIEAAARLEPADPLELVTIVGDGPLASELAALSLELGVRDRVGFAGPLAPAEVRAQMERADLMVMPSVVAADGSRDALPVVVLEALAMELPVVASAEVGLPEVIGPEWGRLVPPGDSDALAAGIAELLALPVERRQAMGAAGRAFVAEHHDLERQTAKLLELIDRGV